MAFQTPPNFSAGQVVTDTELDKLSDNETNLNNRITPSSSSVTTSETTTSTIYTDLATTGPAVTKTTGTSALVIMTCQLKNSASNYSVASIAVSGATTLAASDSRCLTHNSTTDMQVSHVFLLTGLTAGSNTFTMKYRVTGGTGTFQLRHLVVIPLSDLA